MKNKIKFKRDYCKNFTLQQSLFFYIGNFTTKQVPCSNSLSRSIVAE